MPLRLRYSKKSNVPILLLPSANGSSFDHEVEKVSGPSLHRGIKRLAAEGLIDGAQYGRGELIATLRTKKVRGLTTFRKRLT